MLNILLDGISILNTYKEGIIVFFIAIFGFGFFIIKHITNDEMDSDIKLLAGFSLGSITLCVISYLLILLAYFWPFLLRPGSFVILFFALFVILKGIWSGELKAVYNIRLIGIGVILFLLLVARLAFLKYIILPSYSDSPIHYQIVSGFLHPSESNAINLSLGNIFNNYYHFGFHSLAAWLASIAQIAPENAISLLGQIFLVIMPISVIFLTYVITKNRNGALFAGLLAALGWSMPAFAVNWGKFPAISSLSTMPAALAFLGIYWHNNAKKPIVLFLGLALLIGITLMHTRIIVCVMLAVICLFLSNKLQTADELGFSQSVRLSLLYVLSLWPLSQLLVDFYSGFPIVVIWLALLPFAFQAYPKLSVGIFFYTLGSWLIAVALPLLIKNSPALFDRQFLEIMLYIPFSILGGAGFAGVMKKLPPNRIMRWVVVIIFTGGVVFTFFRGNSLYPDACCVYFKEDDRIAFQWIQKNTSEHTLVLTSTFNANGWVIGTDAGIWIYPLIRQNTNTLPYNTNWDSFEEIEKICLLGAKEVYIYMGGREYSFKNAQLASGKWTQPVFAAGQTAIYQVSECSK